MNKMKPGISVYLALALVTLAAGATLTIFEGDIQGKISAMSQGTYNPYREFNEWVNSFVFSTGQISYLYNLMGEDSGYYFTSYLRDLMGGTLLYWGAAGAWHLIIYHLYVDELFTKPKKELPTSAVIVDQMVLAQCSLFLYAGLPILSEFLIENGLTQVYFYVEEKGWARYAIFQLLYICCVEIGIYWVHRTLHTNKWCYKYIHGLHHKYNSAATLTPWASIAFNPIDGLMQASPYVICLLFIPVHYFTHVIMLFFTGMWATNIHDTIPGDTEPVMGAKYHTIHHTHYHCNFGQFFTFCDAYWGTLRTDKQVAKKSS
jgi:lathosterol oxidase